MCKIPNGSPYKELGALKLQNTPYDMAFVQMHVRKKHLTVLKLNENLETLIVIAIWSLEHSIFQIV